mmetsp:Transcript_23440/g.65207  ORF Transcript_23440/g.65207 Transcript_23440/m.65207 type:complete len:511 (-) Transcript_23440:293-1825(-)
MTRLADGSFSNKGRIGPDGIYSHVFEHFVEQHTEYGRRRRQNPTSSLDFKVEGAASPTSLAGPHKSMKMEMGQVRNQEQQHQRTASRASTRARGSSSGLPPHRYTLEELEGMDSDTFLKVLRDDPELAAAFQNSYNNNNNNNKKPQRMKRASGSSGSSSGTGGSKRGGKSSNERATKEEFIEDLRKGGFPVVQWSITVLVVVIATWQLYLLLSGPQANKKQKLARKKHPKRKGTKGKVDEDAEDNLVVEMEKVVAAPQLGQKKKAKRPSKKASKPKTKQQQQQSVEAPAPKVEIPPAKQQENRDAQLAAALAGGWGDEQPDAGEWQTVGKRTVPNDNSATANNEPTVKSATIAATPSNGESHSNTSSKKETKADEVVLDSDAVPSLDQEKPSEKVEPQKQPNPAPVDNSSSTTAKTTKKKKKKAKGQRNGSATAPAGATNAESTNSSSTTEADAVLALELQSEEEKLAKVAASATQKSEVVWEEVTVRRKGRNKSSGNETEALPPQEASA